MKKLRIGIAGLGGIAQKAYLPVLTKTDNWILSGGFSPNQEKARPICDAYRFALFPTLHALAEQCDAVFVHSNTRRHGSRYWFSAVLMERYAILLIQWLIRQCRQCAAKKRFMLSG
ncbi:MAG TPA: hypothetical protein DIT05_04255 [Morganella sp. (in: Bacteria)]|nr:hypothetical protein [Morganella sp. (in: enterobacteria)]